MLHALLHSCAFAPERLLRETGGLRREKTEMLYTSRAACCCCCGADMANK